MNRLIVDLNVRVPVVHIEKNMYLIGSSRCTCTLKVEAVLVRVGGGYERFETYLAANHLQFQLILATHMKNNNWTLEQVVQKLIKGEKIKTNLGAKWDEQGILDNSQMSSLYHANRDEISVPSHPQKKPFKASKPTNLLQQSKYHQ